MRSIKHFIFNYSDEHIEDAELKDEVIQSSDLAESYLHLRWGAVVGGGNGENPSFLILTFHFSSNAIFVLIEWATLLLFANEAILLIPTEFLSRREAVCQPSDLTQTHHISTYIFTLKRLLCFLIVLFQAKHTNIPSIMLISRITEFERKTTWFDSIFRLWISKDFDYIFLIFGNEGPIKKIVHNYTNPYFSSINPCGNMTASQETQQHVWTHCNLALNLKPLPGTAPKISQPEVPCDSISY